MPRVSESCTDIGVINGLGGAMRGAVGVLGLEVDLRARVERVVLSDPVERAPTISDGQ